MNEWKECRPNNMPEDIYPKKIVEDTSRNTLYIGPFLGVNTGDYGKSYFMCSRYKRKNGNWSWSGLHPEAWTEIPEYIKKT